MKYLLTLLAIVLVMPFTLILIAVAGGGEQQPTQPTVIVVEQPAPPPPQPQPVVVVDQGGQPDTTKPGTHESPVARLERNKAVDGNKAEKNKIESGVKPGQGAHPDKGVKGSGTHGPWNTERSPDSPKGTGQDGWCTESDYFASGGQCMNYAPDNAKPKTPDARKLHDAQCDYKSGRITSTEYVKRTKGLRADEEDPLQYRC